MNARFLRSIDPIFEFGTSLIVRIEKNEPIDVQIEQSHVLKLFAEVDAVHGNSQSWQLAKYALAVWIDEICITLPWSGADWWQSHVLEMEFFRTRLCNVRFFELAKQAATLQDRQALEVFYGCVILGFRGMYSTPNALNEDQDGSRYPTTLEHWMTEVSSFLETLSSPDYPLGADRIIRGAPPLPGRRSQIVWATVAALLLVLNVTIASIGWNR